MRTLSAVRVKTRAAVLLFGLLLALPLPVHGGDGEFVIEGKVFGMPAGPVTYIVQESGPCPQW